MYIASGLEKEEKYMNIIFDLFLKFLKIGLVLAAAMLLYH